VRHFRTETSSSLNAMRSLRSIYLHPRRNEVVLQEIERRQDEYEATLLVQFKQSLVWKHFLPRKNTSVNPLDVI
jgi:hypothetical protein